MKLGYHFTDESLLELALTHRSAGRPNNERLEFLGDALVNLVVAEMLFDARERASEGELSRLRAHLVSEPALAERARGLRLGDALKLGSGELKSGGFRRDSILADAFEALVAAIYRDGGYIHWSGWRIKDIQPYDAAKHRPNSFAVQVISAPTEYRESASGPVKHLDGGPATEIVAIRRAQDSWVVTARARLSS